MSQDTFNEVESPRDIYPKFTCPIHTREKFVRICTHPNCERQQLLCGGCLLDDPEHGIEHKQYMKLVKDFIEGASDYYNSERNKTYKSAEISPELLEFVHDFEINNEALAKRFLEEAQQLDLEFEQSIKEIINCLISLREEIKSRIRRNFEVISENYKFVMDKVKAFYNLVTDEELIDLYPTKDIMYTTLYSAESYMECESFVKKIKNDLHQNLYGSPKKQKFEQKKRLDSKNQLLYLSNIVKRQMIDYNCFDFEDSNIKQQGYKRMLSYCQSKGDELVQSIKENIAMHEVEKCLNLPKDALNKVYNVKDFDITEEAITQSPAVLHYFKQNTQNLYLMEVQNLSPASEKIQSEKIQLNIDFKIPYDHGTICLPNGIIYLIGGTDYQKHFKDCFEYSITSKEFNRLPSMKRARSNHGVCFIPDSVYVIGGFDGQKYLRECERFDIISGKWVEIASLNAPTACAAVCSFQDEYIFKIGGTDNKNSYVNIVEKYDINENYWSILNVEISKPSPTDDIIFGESAECTQINNRQILIFGGKHKNTTYNSSYLLDVSNQSVNVKFQGKFKLPYEEYFKCPKSVIVFKGIVFAVSYYMRRVFAFNSFKWQELKVLPLK